MSYESPIRVFVDDMVDALTSALENDLPEVALHYGVAVDKAELIRALKYDRDQYEKGYADGQKDAVKHGHWIFDDFDGDGHDYTCSICNLVSKDEYDYCHNCGARMDEEG